MGEGSAGYNDKSSYGQGIVDIRYWCQKRTLTYQALQLPNGAWLVNGGALKLETQDAVIQIKRQVEMDCMHSDANLSGIKINGIITQLAALTDPIDLAGEQLSFDLLEEQIADLSNVDIGGHPTHILVTPAVFRDLGIQAQNTKGPRYESEGQITGRNFTAGATQMSVFAAGSPDKKIPIISIPYLDEERAYGAPFIPGQGTTLVLAVDPDAKAPATPVVSSGPTPSSSSTSKFTAGEAGSYSYYAIAVNQFGHSAPVAIGTAAVALGEIVTTLFNVPGSNLPDYYLIFRTAKDGAAKTARFLFKVAYVTAGSPAKVVVIDTGAKHRSQSSALILNLSKEEIAFYNLLPLARIPLAMTTLAQPFAVFFSGAPVVKVPLKQRLLTNVAVAASN